MDMQLHSFCSKKEKDNNMVFYNNIANKTTKEYQNKDTISL